MGIKTELCDELEKDELLELEEDGEGDLVREGGIGVAVGHQVGRYVFITVGVAVGMSVAVGMILGVVVGRGMVGLTTRVG